MKVIYICGPFSAPTAWGVAEHVHRARQLAVKVMECGALPVTPHALIGHDVGQDARGWYDGLIELMSRCDGIMLTEDWFSSDGARAEVQAAHAIGKPVFDSLSGLRAWLGSEPKGE